MTNTIPDWAKGLNCAITVCDTEGIILYMNNKAERTFCKGGESLIGSSLFPCHSARSQDKINQMLTDGSSNCYTILKNGIKKMIYQTPWYDGEKIGGLVEFSIEIPEDMPHYNR